MKSLFKWVIRMLGLPLFLPCYLVANIIFLLAWACDSYQMMEEMRATFGIEAVKNYFKI